MYKIESTQRGLVINKYDEQGSNLVSIILDTSHLNKYTVLQGLIEVLLKEKE